MKRTISFLIVMLLVIGMMPANVFAAEVQTISFLRRTTDDTTMTVSQVDYETYGWEAIQAGTGTWLWNDKWATAPVYYNANGLYVYLNKNTSGNNAAIKVRVNETGWYDVQATLGKIADAYNGKISVYVDGAYAGPLSISNGTKRLRPLYLTEGAHTVFFCYDEGINGGTTDARMSVKNFILTPITEDKAQISDINLSLNSDGVFVKETATVSAKLTFKTGATYELYGKSFVKKAFPDYQTIADESYTITSDNPAVATVSGNTVTGVSAGIANLTFTANLGDCGTYTKTIPVTVHTKINFVDDLASVPSSSNKVAPDAIKFKDSTRVEVVASESSNYTSHDDRVYEIGANKTKVLQLDLGRTPTGNWIAQRGNKNTKWTIKVPLAKAGWYNLEILRSLWWANANFYVYADDQYAGYYSFTTDKPTDGSTGWKMSEADASNTLYLTPDEDGFVKIMFAFDTDFGYNVARMQLRELAIRPAAVEDKLTCVDIVHTLPEEMQYGDSASFTAYAVMSDGTRRHINGYKFDATADTSNSINVVSEGSGFAVQRTSDPIRDDGNYAGTIGACGIGQQNVKLSVLVDGEPYEETATINVKQAVEPVSFSMVLSSEGLKYPDKSAPSAWRTVGYEVVLEKTADYPTNRYYDNYDKGVAQIYTNGKHFPEDMSKDSRITFKTIVPYEGYYNIEFSGYKWSSNSDYSIYINGEYAGETCCYAPGLALSSAYATRNLNTLYLPNGEVEISFRLRKKHTYADIFTPKSLDFTPATVSEIAISAVEITKYPKQWRSELSLQEVHVLL